MGKIVRLTESDLVRIVKRVINEGTASGPFIVNGKKYNLLVYGNGTIGYDNGMGVAATDPAMIKKLNALSGMDMPSTGVIEVKKLMSYPKLFMWYNHQR
jgi:hypothetical protein